MTVALRRPEACSILSAESGEPLAATAPTPRAWLALEQPGPWGRKAPSASHLDQALGAELDARAKAAGVTFVLLRRPGRHADTHVDGPRTALAAHPEAGWVTTTTVGDPAELLTLDLSALAAGDRPAWADGGRPVLVCTNGRRDLCCAEVGRQLVARLAPTLGERLWESSHLGGHRFAPTVLLLASGVVLGRAGADQVMAAVGGRPPLECYRGRTALSPPAQAAEAFVLGREGAGEFEHLEVGRPQGEGPWIVTVRHHDGREWRVAVAEESGLERPESCGRTPEPWTTLRVTAVEDPQG